MAGHCQRRQTNHCSPGLNTCLLAAVACWLVAAEFGSGSCYTDTAAVDHPQGSEEQARPMVYRIALPLGKLLGQMGRWSPGGWDVGVRLLGNRKPRSKALEGCRRTLAELVAASTPHKEHLGAAKRMPAGFGDGPVASLPRGCVGLDPSEGSSGWGEGHLATEPQHLLHRKVLGHRGQVFHPDVANAVKVKKEDTGLYGVVRLDSGLTEILKGWLHMRAAGLPG